MIGFLRVMLVWAVVGVVAWFLLRLYFRSLRREALEKEWDARQEAEALDGPGNAAAREAFIRQGMAEFEGSLRNRLLVIIIVLPFFAIALLLYLVNYA